MRNFIFIITAGFFSGVVTSFLLSLTIAFVSGVGVTLLLATIVILIVARFFRKAVVISLFVASFFIGVLVGGGAPMQESTLPFERDSVITGTVVGDIEHRKNTDRYLVSVERVNGKQQEKEERVLVYEPYPTACSFGDFFQVGGRITRPEPFITTSSRVFPYHTHLSKDNIHGILFITQGKESTVCTGSETYHRGTFFSRVRLFVVGKLEEHLPEPESSLLGGLLLGLRGSLTTEFLEAFRVTGLLHIIVLSGYNVMIVAEAVRRLIVRLPISRNYALGVAGITIIAFVLLSGAQTAAVRAGIMATIGLFARLLHRENDGLRALALAGCIMVAINPAQLLYDVSFHLSFLATAGLLLYTPIIEKKLHRITDRFQLRNIIAITLSVQMFLLPYLAYRIGEASLIGVVANIFVLPLVPIAMGFGFLVILVGTVIPPLAPVVAPLAYLSTHAIVLIATILAVPMYASIALPTIPPFVMLILYIPFVVFAIQWRKKNSFREETPING